MEKEKEYIITKITEALEGHAELLKKTNKYVEVFLIYNCFLKLLFITKCVNSTVLLYVWVRSK